MIKPVYEYSAINKNFWLKLFWIFGIGFLYLLGIGVIGLDIFLITLDSDLTSIDFFTFSYLFYFMFGIAIICFGFWSMMTIFAVYRFETEGLYIKYPFRKEKCVSWDEFQQICLIYELRTGGNTFLPNTVICFVRKGEKKNFLKRWKTMNIFKYDKVFTIPYKGEIYEGIKEKYPHEIVDLRNTPGYESWK